MSGGGETGDHNPHNGNGHVVRTLNYPKLLDLFAEWNPCSAEGLSAQLTSTLWCGPSEMSNKKLRVAQNSNENPNTLGRITKNSPFYTRKGEGRAGAKYLSTHKI